MNETPTISVVMPVYNVEKYLRECLDSVRAQTFTDWECICVDDGSTDASPAILDEYAAKDSRFRGFRREHSNAGAVRNFGMTKATGDYLAFLDSDDVFSPWIFETLLAKATATKADIVACSEVRFPDGTPVPSFPKPTNLSWTDFTPDADWSRNPLGVGCMPWNKILKHGFIKENHLWFLEQTSTNDLTFMALALSLSRSTVKTNTPLVGYRQREASIQARKSKHPRNYFQAMSAFHDGLVSRNRWNALSAQGRRKWYMFFAKTSVGELLEQTTRSGYRDFYVGILEMNQSLCVATMIGAETSAFPPAVRRFLSIAKESPKERLRAFVESIFAPLLGNSGRRHGFRRKLATRMQRVICRLFE